MILKSNILKNETHNKNCINTCNLGYYLKLQL